VGDAGVAGQRMGSEQGFQVAHLALGALAPQAVGGEQGHAGGIVAAVFQRLQAVDQGADHVAPRRSAHDSAHGEFLASTREAEV